jgi:pimeloyl-ACP methyl ester carboxylesterase
MTIQFVKGTFILISLLIIAFVASELKLFEPSPQFESKTSPNSNVNIAEHVLTYGSLTDRSYVSIAYSVVTSKSQTENKPILVLVHGFPETGRIAFEPIFALAENYTLIVPDLRGYGRSRVFSHEDYTGDYSVEASVQDFLKLFEEVSPGIPVDIVGHDSGGLVVWKLLESYPGKIRKAIVLTTPHPAAYKKSVTPSFESSLWLKQLWKSRYAFYFSSDVFYYFMYIGQWSWLDKAALSYGKFSVESVEKLHQSWNIRMSSMLNWYRSMLSNPSTTSTLSEGTNVLIVKPEQDFAFESETVEASCLFVRSKCEIETIKGADHFINHDDPEAVMKIINHYLQK